ncbi:MAG: hypothetical protein ACPL25_09625 [Ignavibacteria bacterium]
MFDLGYILYNNYGLKIFPLVGFGAGGIDLRINEKASLDFTDVLNNPQRGSSLSLSGIMFNFGLNGSYIFNFNEKKDNGGILIGLSMGYTYFLKIGNWTLFESDISGGPDIGISGFYFRFNIGGGGSGKYSEEK